MVLWHVLNGDGDALVALAIATNEKEIDYSILKQCKEENSNEQTVSYRFRRKCPGQYSR